MKANPRQSLASLHEILLLSTEVLAALRYSSMWCTVVLEVEGPDGRVDVESNTSQCPYALLPPRQPASLPELCKAYVGKECSRSVLFKVPTLSSNF